RAGRAVLTFGTVRCRLTTEMVPLHYARIALALTHAHHIDVLHFVENIDVNGVARLAVGCVLQADLTEMLPWSHARLAGMADEREGAEASLDLAKAELNGVIAVVLDCLHLGDGARPGLNDRDGDNSAVLVVDPRHADFFSKQCRRHDKTSSSTRALSGNGF